MINMNIMNLFNKNKNMDFLSIGDIVVDAFIRIEASAEVVNNGDSKKICIPFGEKVPFESLKEVLGVGNSANASVSVSRLGIKSGLLTHTGDDYYGHKNVESLQKDKVNTEFVSIDNGKKTNYHYVLWHGDERTILINHEKYQYQIPALLKNKKVKPKYIYLSSLGENTLEFHLELSKYLQENPEIKLVFQPGTFQIKFGINNLKDIYSRTEIFFCNKEEAIKILNLPINTDIKELLLGLKNLGVVLPVITDGPLGSYTYDESGKIIHIKIYPDIAPPVDRTGAGDAFASTFSAAKYLGLNNKTALMWGSINSMSVCQCVGAQEGLLSREKIDYYINNKPSEWNIETID
jgi:ribokinase